MQPREAWESFSALSPWQRLRLLLRPAVVRWTLVLTLLAILSQWRAEARIVMSLPPEAFTPPPKVSSSVVHLTAMPEPRFPAQADTLSRVVAAAFNQRRKMLRASLKGVAPDIEDRLRASGIEPTARAETVDLENFCALARNLKG